MIRRWASPQARRDLLQAVDWIAKDNSAAANQLVDVVLEAVAMIAKNPNLARSRADLAPGQFRFWSLRSYPY